MNNFKQGDPVFVDRFKEYGVIEHVERNKVIVLLINQKTIQIQPFECELLESDEIELDCSECDGTGMIDVMRCRNASMDCCGGCYESETCFECEGSGTMTKDIFELI